jgi:xanthine dehydrogenase YagR molybdenum-binding subunit
LGVTTGTIGVPTTRLEAREKVTGAARYAYEHPQEQIAYAVPVCATVARGTVRTINADRALARSGVLAVLSHENAPPLHEVDDRGLLLFQSDRVHFRGQIVAAVVADRLEVALEAASVVEVEYAAEAHDVVLRLDHPAIYTPERVNGGMAATSLLGGAEAALAGAEVTIDETYVTAPTHNNPMEPHASLVRWDGDSVTVHDSVQGSSPARETLAALLALDLDRVHVIARHVGGGFGSKGTIRPQVVLAVLAARATGRPVKVALTRAQMFPLTGYRTPTIQRVAVGASRDGTLTAVVHQALSQTSTVHEFVEQSASVSRVMYSAPNRQTTHHVVALDVPTPSWMRAPGEAPGLFALECAIDELAVALGIDPIELRIRNEPVVHPENGRAWSSRNLVACLRTGAERFGWAARRSAGTRQEGNWRLGVGVAASMYPTYRSPARADVRALDDGTYEVRIAATDIGTGARTALAQVAAEALGVGLEQIRIEIGDSDLPRAGVAGGSMGTGSWGSAVWKACKTLRANGSDQASADTTDDVESLEPYARHAFGAQFADVRVDTVTGEVRVNRLLGVFAAGRIINPTTARSQFLGGMTMGLGMALLEESVMDPTFGDYLNHDLAGYHVAVNADVEELDAIWVDEHDPHLNPMGSKGIGELGITGTAAAIANAVYDATGVRIRRVPITLEQLL